MKKGSKEDITRQINHFTAKHQELDEELAAELRKRMPDTIRLRRIKKLKLMCKDKLSQLKTKLAEKLRPPKPSAEVIPLPVSPSTEIVSTMRRVASG